MNPPEKRAIAFLDILGFKNFVCEAEKQVWAREKLWSLKHVIESHIHRDNDRLAPSVPDDVKPRYLFISDSIILSAPLQSDGYDGLVIVAIKSIEIAHKLLEMGFLLRGGIAVGNAWHEANNIFGTGYIEAFQLEESVKPPHIVLSDGAAKHLQSAKHRSVPLADLGLWWKDGHVICLDTLNPSYIRGIEARGRIESAFKQYRAYIYSTLSDPKIPDKIREKWKAMRTQFDDALKRHSIDIEPIGPLIPVLGS